MKKLIISFAVFWVCTATNSSLYAVPATLYPNYTFGMSKAEIKKDSRVYDCSEEFEKGALCLGEQKFVGVDIEIGFRFVQNKLVAVVLMSEFTQDNYVEFVGVLNSKFQLVAMEDEDNKIDFLVQLKKHKRARFLENITDFEQRALGSGHIKYTFVEKDSFQRLAKSSANSTEMIMKAHINIRAVEYTVSDFDENIAVNLIQFTAPNRTLQLVQAKSNKKYGDF